MKSNKYVQKLLNLEQNPSPKSELFPYKYFDEEKQLFINENNTIGFLLKASPIVGVDNKLYNQLLMLFNQFLPENGTLQFLLIADPNIESELNIWLKGYEAADDILRTLASKRIKFLNELTIKGPENYTLKDYKLYIAFSLQDKDLNKLQTTIIEFREQLESNLNSINIGSRRVGKEEFIHLISYLVSPSYKNRPYNDYEIISNQIAPGSPLLFSDEEIIQEDDYITRCYEIEFNPSEDLKQFDIALMVNLLGDASRDSLQIPGRMYISYTISNNINESQQLNQKIKAENLVKQENNILSKLNFSLKREIEESKQVLYEVANNNKFVTTSLVVVLSDKESKIRKNEQQLKAIYNLNGFNIKRIKYFLQTRFLSSLPFINGVGVINTLKTYNYAKTTITKEPLALLPIHAEWKGNATNGGICLAGRRGQIAIWDNFVGSSNPNALIFAESGAGKSFLMQEILVNHIAKGTKVFVIDIGRSYLNLCRFLGGEFIEFNLKSNICLNPFSNVIINTPEEEDDFLSNIFPVIAKMAAPKRGTTDLEDAILATVIKEVWRQYKNETDITKIAERLNKDNAEIARNLGTMLFKFTKDGVYGRFFNGKANISFKSRITVFEFEEIKDRLDITPVIMQMLTVLLMGEVFTGDRTKKKIIAIDEGRFCLNHFPHALVNWYSTVRKYGAAAILATQSISDCFVYNDVAKSILENASWMIMLQQTEEALKKLESADNFTLDQNKINLIRSVVLKPGVYSEIYLASKTGFVVGRVILDPFSRMLFSTTPEDFSTIQKFTSLGMSVSEAVEKLAIERFGYA